MKELKIKQTFERVKQSVSAMPKKKRIILGGGTLVLIAFAVVLTVMLNTNRSTYRVLYPGMSATETSDVYPILKDMGANPKLNETGEIMVLDEEYDIWLLQLAAKGYPRTTLTYDIYKENSGITTTDAEQQQWKIYQLQDLIQGTLKRLSGVDSATVLLNVPKTSDFAWPGTESQRATASVTLSLREGVTLDNEQIVSIKNLIASSISNMDPADVTVVDAATMKEFTVKDENATGITVAQNLEYEQIVQRQLEDNVVRLLEARYGVGGVVATAKVSLNYDKMISEQLQLEEKPLGDDGTGGGGYVTSTEGGYGTNEQITIGGIVGEEDNTDIPGYTYAPANNDDADATYYRWKTDYDYSYLKTQIEKGNAKLERATISVMVDEKNLTQARREELVSLISRSVDIEPDLVFVSAYTPDAIAPLPSDENAGDAEPVTGNFLSELLSTVPLWMLIAVGALLLVIITVIIFLLVRRKRKKKRLMALEQKQQDEARQMIEDEITQYKKQLTDAAKAGKDPKEDAILTEIRDFAKINPEITASLLRSWLKEGE